MCPTDTESFQSYISCQLFEFDLQERIDLRVASLILTFKHKVKHLLASGKFEKILKHFFLHLTLQQVNDIYSSHIFFQL